MLISTVPRCAFKVVPCISRAMCQVDNINGMARKGAFITGISATASIVLPTAIAINVPVGLSLLIVGGAITHKYVKNIDSYKFTLPNICDKIRNDHAKYLGLLTGSSIALIYPFLSFPIYFLQVAIGTALLGSSSFIVGTALLSLVGIKSKRLLKFYGLFGECVIESFFMTLMIFYGILSALFLAFFFIVNIYDRVSQKII